MASKGERESSRAVLVFHVVVTTLLSFCGGVLLGVSIWATVSKNNEVFGLNYTGSSIVNVVARLSVAGIILGGGLVVIGLMGYLASIRGGCGTFWKVVYGILAVLTVGLLVAIAVVNLLLATKSSSGEIENFFRNAWVRSVQDPNYVEQVCQIEQTYQCRGFYDSSCMGCSSNGGCNNTKQQLECPTCDAMADPSITIGCWNKVTQELRKYAYPVGIVSAVLAGLVSMDVVAICVI